MSYQQIEGNDHVLSIEEDNVRVPGGSGQMLTIGDLISLYSNHLIAQNIRWFRTGIRCRLLQLGSEKWVRGTVKIRLNLVIDFKPDEPQTVTPLLERQDNG